MAPHVPGICRQSHIQQHQAFDRKFTTVYNAILSFTINVRPSEHHSTASLLGGVAQRVLTFVDFTFIVLGDQEKGLYATEHWFFNARL
jgi:hypothetical protein